MVKSPWPQPPLSTRKRIVKLIEDGNHDEALEILHGFYEIPRPIKVITPRQALESTDPCITILLPHMFAFDFVEWKKLKEDFPSKYKEFEKKVREYLPPEVDVSEFLGEGRRVGGVLNAIPDINRECPDFIVASEKHIYHPALAIHEFHHLLWGYLNIEQEPDFGASISLPETWDKWTRDFLTDVKPEPWYPWILPSIIILTFVAIPIAWTIAWTVYPQNSEKFIEAMAK